MLVSLLIAILVIGLIVYLVQILPLPPPFKTAAICVVVVICIIWLLSMFGGGLGGNFGEWGCHR